MGLLLAKCFRCCSNCFTSSASRNRNSVVGVLPERRYKALLLGLGGSGKTEVGHILSGKPRLDYESTNGVQCYQTQQLTGGQLTITEVGGNVEMQKIWHHYYATTMGILYCFDLSSNYAELQASFELLQRVLTHPYIRGKPVLLIATKTDMVDEGVQLYDIENAFQLETLARHFACSIHLTCAGKGEVSNLFAGAQWLLKFLRQHRAILEMRIKCDVHEKNYQEQVQKVMAEAKQRRRRYQRFPHKIRNKLWGISNRRHTRPHTAPAGVYSIPVAKEPREETVQLTTSIANAAKRDKVPKSNSNSSRITDV